jgi:hypothetical protein
VTCGLIRGQILLEQSHREPQSCRWGQATAGPMDNGSAVSLPRLSQTRTSRFGLTSVSCIAGA